MEKKLINFRLNETKTLRVLVRRVKLPAVAAVKNCSIRKYENIAIRPILSGLSGLFTE